MASLNSWLLEPLHDRVKDALERLLRAPDVKHVAVMPDVHFAGDVCVGTVFSTSRLLYPQAVGGDIGCGMLAVPCDASAEALNDPGIAGRVLAELGFSIPTHRRRRRLVLPMPESLAPSALSHPSLISTCRDEGMIQLGTLGGGNHFIELQSDQQERLWLTIHSGSRAMGQAIRAHHLAGAEPVGSGLLAVDAATPAGAAYASDVDWARRYAAANRQQMAEIAGGILHSAIGASLLWDQQITTDHNHVAQERHDQALVWVHRKGAAPADQGMPGVIPGSMGTASFHVEGRGCAAALRSSAHGAGRSLSRESARGRITTQDIHQQMRGIWYDYRIANTLREESPRAYKDIHAVMRAQKDLVKVVRTLRPILNYKGR